MTQSKAIMPQTPDDCMTLAKYFYTAEFIKKQYQSAGEVFFIINLGLEVGLAPAQSVQNIAIISGRACIWGDAMLAIIQGSGAMSFFEEKFVGDLDEETLTALCTVQRSNATEKTTSSFGTDDAKRAGLWLYGTSDWKKKKMPWAAYPQRMLQMRARTFALRDAFSDVLKGLTSIEEARDIPNKTDTPKRTPAVIITEEEKPQKPKKQTIGQNPTPSVVVEAICESLKAPQNEPQEPQMSEIKKSELLGEHYIVDQDGSAHLETGITYTKEEISNLILLGRDKAKEFHSIRLIRLGAGDGKEGGVPENLYTKSFKNTDGSSLLEETDE